MNARPGLTGVVIAGLMFGCMACERKAADRPTSELPESPDAAAPVTSDQRPNHKAVVVEELEPYECGDITRLHTYRGLFLASQPKPEDFERAKNGGIKTVVNLRTESEVTDFDEPGIVTGLGLTYVSLPFGRPAELTDEMFARSLAMFRTVERPALIHCSSANRVGAIWAAYRAIDGGLDWEAALAEAKTVGLKSPDYEKLAREYVENHRTEQDK